MASKGVPTAGLNEFLRRLFGMQNCTLICYTNTANSLGDNTVYADLVQPSVANGYAPITIDKTLWTYSSGAAVYSGNTQWSATGTWSATINGYALISTDASPILLIFKDLDTPFVASSGGKLAPNLQDILVPS